MYGAFGVGADRLAGEAWVVDVSLSQSECRQAAYVGINRRLGAMGAGSTEVYGAVAGGDYWTVDVEAAAGELAVAKALGVFWCPKDSAEEDREGGDVAGLQVRHTRRLTGSLICHNRDRDEDRFVLVLGAMPVFRVAGWIDARAAKSEEFWREDVPRAAFFVPQHRLRPLDEL